MSAELRARAANLDSARQSLSALRCAIDAQRAFTDLADAPDREAFAELIAVADRALQSADNILFTTESTVAVQRLEGGK